MLPAPGASSRRAPLSSPRFGPDGLVTCVATDVETGELLMVAHMNADALARTLETGEAWYWSQSGANSGKRGNERANPNRAGNQGRLRPGRAWLKVRVAGDGGCCHTGRRSCFYRVVEAPGSRTLAFAD